MAAHSQPTLELRVAGRRLDPAGAVVLDLRWPDGAPLPPFTAGAHIDLHLPNGLVRQYSLWNDPAERHRYCVAVRLEVAGRGGSRAIHQLLPGQRVRVGVPRNHFGLDETAVHTVLIGAGIGITPLLAMAARLAASKASFELHFRAAAREWAPLVETIETSSWRDACRFHFGDRKSFDLGGIVGSSAPGRQLFVCGPRGFMDAVKHAAGGWPAANLHTELFARDEPPTTDGVGFELELARTGRSVAVAAGQSMLAAIRDAGVVVPTSCEEGICGTCRTRVLAGVPEHRDMVLTEAERRSNSFVTPCCSRALTPRLVLDL
ncbi:MAG: PDR/VanB family oxidoreductase [Devosia sp.]|nr:PDR/VanB family oxidoreductase [Devosia sp.]